MGRGQGDRPHRARDPAACQFLVAERRFYQHRPQGGACRGFLRHRCLPGTRRRLIPTISWRSWRRSSATPFPFEWSQPMRRRNLCQRRANARSRRRAMGTDAGDDAGAGHPASLPWDPAIPLARRLPDGRARQRSDAVFQSTFRFRAGHQFRAVVELPRSVCRGDGTDFRLHRGGYAPHAGCDPLLPQRGAAGGGAGRRRRRGDAAARGCSPGSGSSSTTRASRSGGWS